MNIVYINISDLTPYANNAKKHPKSQVKQIAQSIIEFGNCDPIAIWGSENTIVEGHGRYEALKLLNANEIPCIRLDHLTDSQRKAYALAHNQLTLNTGYDEDILSEELDGLIDIDMSDFGFDITQYDIDSLDLDGVSYYGDERERTYSHYNLDIIDFSALTQDFFEMPTIRNDHYIPSRMIGFNYAKSSNDKTATIHFYLDDYQFERVWSRPREYIKTLSEYEAILTPDFSLYMDMPMPIKIFNVFRSRLIGQYYQRHGITVIPTISWAEPETYRFCFSGIPKGSIVSISTIGIKRDETSFNIFKDGVREMLRVVQPETILVYGGKVDVDYGSADVIYYDNEVTQRMRKRS